MTGALLACAAGAFLLQLPASPAPTATIPTEATHEVIVEGRAPLGPAGREAARKAAIAQALRGAVENTTEVLVQSATLTRNYQLIRDRVITHADGYATPEAVLRETDDAIEVRVTVRILVSLHPLARTLKALNLTHSWHLHLDVQPFKLPGMRNVAPVSMQPALEKAFSDVGLVIVPPDQPADIAVEVTNRSGAHSDTEQARADGMDVHAEVTARATMIRTGEVIAVQFGDYPDEALRPNAIQAQLQNMCDHTTAQVVPRLTEQLLLGPARAEQAISLEVDGIHSLSRAVSFEKTLLALPQVRSAVRKRYEKGNVEWVLQVLADTESVTVQDLTAHPTLKPYHLTILSDEPTRIVAATDSVGPNFPVNGIDASPRSPYVLPTSIESINGLVRLKPSTPVALPALPGSALVYDSFDYTPGQAVIGKGENAQGWSGPWVTPHRTTDNPHVVAGSLYYPHLKIAGNAVAGPGVEVARRLNPPLGAPGETIYISTLIRPTPPTPREYVWLYACLNINGVRIGKTRGTANVGIMTDAMLYTPNKFLATSVPMNLDTTYFLVGRLTIGTSNSTFDLFVDPDPEKPLPSKPDATLTVNVTRIDELIYEAETPCTFDELRVGATYASVAPTW